ncbi:MAG TPA: S41 family peptidase [Steroidobacteraceae bacterium]|nr:S41 family peptidase [Steroidobacteraceae bacterium]
MVMHRLLCLRLLACLFCIMIVTGCNHRGETSSYTPGVYKKSSGYAGQCSAVDQNFWLRSWTHELYLWYSEVKDIDPNSYADPVNDYFPLLKTTATTPSGNPKDKFHFTYKTSDWIALSQSGQSAGYGAEFVILKPSTPRVVVVAYVDPNTPAAANNLSRGELLITVDGVDVANGTDTTTLNNGTFPTASGQSHTFVLQELDGTTQRTVTMTSTIVTSTPVQNVGVIPGTNGQVGYIQFNDHIATAEQEFIDAVNTLKNDGVSDLVLDIRYNGGGYLDLASEVAYMIAGDTQTSGKTFEQATFNDQYPTNVNPVTGGDNPPTPFHSTTQGFSATAGQPLPTLNLSRVYILTGSGTCSASEAIINGLRGAGVEVIQIGSTTCGKPYGFYPQDNCGTTYFSIELKGTNDAGFGDYTDGFFPANSTNPDPDATVPGCSVADDFTHQLGDPAEARLAAALYYRTNSSCMSGPTGTSLRSQIQSVNEKIDLSKAEGEMYKNPFRENRILRK